MIRRYPISRRLLVPILMVLGSGVVLAQYPPVKEDDAEEDDIQKTTILNRAAELIEEMTLMRGQASRKVVMGRNAGDTVITSCANDKLQRIDRLLADVQRSFTDLRAATALNRIDVRDAEVAAIEVTYWTIVALTREAEGCTGKDDEAREDKAGGAAQTVIENAEGTVGGNATSEGNKGAGESGGGGGGNGGGSGDTSGDYGGYDSSSGGGGDFGDGDDSDPYDDLDDSGDDGEDPFEDSGDDDGDPFEETDDSGDSGDPGDDPVDDTPGDVPTASDYE